MKKELTSWFEKNKQVIGVCVINKFCLLRMESGIVEVRKEENNPKYWETLVFIGKIYPALLKIIKSRQNISPDWEAYMQN